MHDVLNDRGLHVILLTLVRLQTPGRVAQHLLTACVLYCPVFAAGRSDTDADRSIPHFAASQQAVTWTIHVGAKYR
jgi:hypothetical protein